jgi:ABC-type transport system substrate-binding protein
VGENRGGWSNSEYDRLWEAFATTMDGAERTRQLAGLMRLLSEQVPVYMLYFSVQIIAHVAVLRGPEAGLPGTGALSLETLPHWNIHDWELR